MTHKNLDQLGSLLSIANGQLKDVGVNLYAIVRDEIFFMPAFFDHYRRIGVEQFVIMDDGSIDGTKEFLNSQSDCVVLTSPLSFGEKVDVRFPDRQVASKRWGQIAKSVIPRQFFQGKYAIYVDADEFMILPSGVGFADIFEMLEADDSNNMAACMLDFFPGEAGGLSGEASPQCFDDLVGLYPYFDAQALLSIQRGSWPKGLAETPTSRLMKKHSIGGTVKKRGWQRFFKNKVEKNRSMSAARKTPIAKWNDDVWLANSHDMNTPPTPDAMLALAHFKLTHSLRNKITNALKWRSYSRGSRQYAIFDELLNAIEQSGGDMLGPKSERFTSADRLEEIGLIEWPR